MTIKAVIFFHGVLSILNPDLYLYFSKNHHMAPLLSCELPEAIFCCIFPLSPISAKMCRESPQFWSGRSSPVEFKFLRWELRRLRRPAGEKIKTWLYSLKSVSHQFYHQNKLWQEFIQNMESQVLFKVWALRFNEFLYFTVVLQWPILKPQGFKIQPMKYICLFKIK